MGSETHNRGVVHILSLHIYAFTIAPEFGKGYAMEGFRGVY